MGGDHVPTLPVLKRILAMLDEELLISIERQVPGEEPKREVGISGEARHGLSTIAVLIWFARSTNSPAKTRPPLFSMLTRA